MLKNNFTFSNVSEVVKVSLYLCLAALVAGLIIFVWFLYQNFYLTLTSANDVLILKSTLALESLDNDTFTQAKKLSELRSVRKLIDWREVRNPFAN